jgi:hypothetical protein
MRTIQVFEQTNGIRGSNSHDNDRQQIDILSEPLNLSVSIFFKPPLTHSETIQTCFTLCRAKRNGVMVMSMELYRSIPVHKTKEEQGRKTKKQARKQR